MMADWTSIQLSDVRSGFRVDAEFYRENFIELDQKLASLNCVSLGRLATVTDGEHGSVNLVPDGVKYLTAENVKQGYVDFENVRFVDATVDQRNARARVNVGDVLVSIKGTLGEVGVAEPQLLPANMNRDVAIIKPFSTSPSGHYICAFLRSSYGAYQMAREGSGGVQQMITLERLRGVQVPILSSTDISLISAEYEKGLSTRKHATNLFAKSQKLLESELGLDTLQFGRSVKYATRFGTAGLFETLEANRIDAQCFSPEAAFYEHLLSDRARCDRLATLLASIAKGRQQAETISGSKDYCSIKHITGREVVGAAKASPGVDTPTARSDDLLLAITGATIGKIGIVKRYEELVFSGDILRLRPNADINPHYLLLVLNHHLGQVQFNRWITGSTNGHLAPRDVERVLVPRLSLEKEDEIAALVEDSLGQRQESEKLLEQAKVRVEQLIKEALEA